MVTSSPTPTRWGRIWNLASSPVAFVVLSILWCLDLAVGSIYAYQLDPQFWVKMDAYPFNVWLREVAPEVFPHSWWVYGLVALTYVVVLSLVVCTLNWFFRRRRRGRGVGEVLVHLGFLLVFAGFVLGSGFGTRLQGVRVPLGETVALEPLGFSLRLAAVDVVRGPGGRPMDAVAQVQLLREGEVDTEATIRTNHPLLSGATVVYPQGAQSSITGAVLAIEKLGTRTLRLDQDAAFDDGRVFRLTHIVPPGERRGGHFGPGFVVALLDAREEQRGEIFLSATSSRVAELEGVRLRLVDLVISQVGVFNIHRDPGIWLVMVGAVILTLGTFWALAGYLGLTSLRAVPL